MSAFGIASTLLGLVQSAGSGGGTQSKQNGSGHIVIQDDRDFSSSLALHMAGLQAQTFNTLLGSAFNSEQKTSGNDPLSLLAGIQSGSGPSFGSESGSNGLLPPLGLPAAARGLTANARNLSLFDPESAYRMMSVINTDDVTYKAQFSELSEMKTWVARLQQAGQTLGSVSDSLDDATIKTQLQSFADQYNSWIARFDGTVHGNGLLAGTQAAEISLYELGESVKNIFNGAGDGFHGMRDLGLVIDPATRTASLDTAKLEAALSNNRHGAIDTVQEFGANFARSAELLNSTNNFIPNRLGNLNRVIDYIGANITSLRAEFGLGDPAKPSSQVAKALAAYNQMLKA